jgi:hypothetical protein
MAEDPHLLGILGMMEAWAAQVEAEMGAEATLRGATHLMPPRALGARVVGENDHFEGRRPRHLGEGRTAA